MDLEGTYTALVTPFLDPQAGAEPAIDWKAYDTLIEDQIAGGVRGLVPCGTTGESPALSDDEKREVIARTVKVARGRAQVIAGTGSNATHHTIEQSRAAEKAGVDAVMVVVPYYNKPTQEGLYQHYVAVAKSVSCPVIVYNIPGRTGIDLAADTQVRICETAKNVIGVKEATGNVLRAQELVRRLGKRVSVLSGDDGLTLAMCAVGARGVISVTSNLLPGAVSRATEAALRGTREEALKLHQALVPIHEAMFLEANPSPVKAALHMRGKMRDVVRGPLVPLSDSARKKLATILETAP